MRRLHGESLEGRHLLAVITVDTLVDEMDGSIDDGDVSLRDAIGLASDRDTIDFATTLDGGTILLTQGELQITRLITIDASMLPNGLTIDASGNDPTPDNGDGSRIFNISDGDVGTDSPVTIRGLTLTSGDVDGYGGAVYSRESLTLTDSTISENSAGDGGAIYSDGDVAVTNSTISGNFGGGILAISVAVTDSTISGSFGRGISTIVSVAVTNSTILENFGGGIFTRGSVAVTDSMILDNGFQGIRALGDVTVTASTISRNSGSGIDANDVTVTASTISENSGRGGVIDGSGIDANGDVTVANSTISGNSGSGIRADGDGTVTNVTNSTISGNLGGGIYVFEAVTVTSSTISGNSTGFFRDGGGIYAGHDVTVNDSTISGNSATRRGGGIFSPTVAITNSTISENSTVRDGGGVYSSGVVTVTHSTISGNSAGSSGGGIHARLGYSARLVIENSIVAGNTASGNGPDIDYGNAARVDARFSLIGDNSGTGLSEAQTPDESGNLIGDPKGEGHIDPLLGPLADNGGPIPTHALLPGSPAINSGDPSFIGPPDQDQRGAPFRRVSSGQLDMGAFEYQIAPADYNDDQQLDCNDVDALVAAIVDGNHPPEFDLTGDELADQADLDVWLALAGLENLPTHKPYLFGDADLGGLVTTRDLNTVGVNWRQEVTGWCRGDFNADGRVDAKDLNLLAINWKKDVVDPNVAPGVPRVPQATLADRAVAIAAVASDRATLLGSTAKKLPGNISIDSGTGAVSSSHFAKRYIRRELSRTAATAVPSVPLPPPGNLTESLTGRRWPQS